MLLTRAVLIVSLWRERREPACSLLPVPAEHVLQESFGDVCSQRVPCARVLRGPDTAVAAQQQKL